MGSLHIYNIKASLKCPLKIPIEGVVQQWQGKFNLRTRLYASFVVLRDCQSSLRFIIFRKRFGFKFAHVNVTGYTRVLRSDSVNDICT